MAGALLQLLLLLLRAEPRRGGAGGATRYARPCRPLKPLLMIWLADARSAWQRAQEMWRAWPEARYACLDGAVAAAAVDEQLGGGVVAAVDTMRAEIGLVGERGGEVAVEEERRRRAWRGRKASEGTR